MDMVETGAIHKTMILETVKTADTGNLIVVVKQHLIFAFQEQFLNYS